MAGCMGVDGGALLDAAGGLVEGDTACGLMDLSIFAEAQGMTDADEAYEFTKETVGSKMQDGACKDCVSACLGGDREELSGCMLACAGMDSLPGMGGSAGTGGGLPRPAGDHDDHDDHEHGDMDHAGDKKPAGDRTQGDKKPAGGKMPKPSADCLDAQMLDKVGEQCGAAFCAVAAKPPPSPEEEAFAYLEQCMEALDAAGVRRLGAHQDKDQKTQRLAKLFDRNGALSNYASALEGAKNVYEVSYNILEEIGFTDKWAQIKAKCCVDDGMGDCMGADVEGAGCADELDGLEKFGSCFHAAKKARSPSDGSALFSIASANAFDEMKAQKRDSLTCDDVKERLLGFAASPGACDMVDLKGGCAALSTTEGQVCATEMKDFGVCSYKAAECGASVPVDSIVFDLKRECCEYLTGGGEAAGTGPTCDIEPIYNELMPDDEASEWRRLSEEGSSSYYYYDPGMTKEEEVAYTFTMIGYECLSGLPEQFDPYLSYKNLNKALEVEFEQGCFWTGGKCGAALEWVNKNPGCLKVDWKSVVAGQPMLEAAAMDPEADGTVEDVLALLHRAYGKCAAKAKEDDKKAEESDTCGIAQDITESVVGACCKAQASGRGRRLEWRRLQRGGSAGAGKSASPGGKEKLRCNINAEGCCDAFGSLYEKVGKSAKKLDECLNSARRSISGEIYNAAKFVMMSAPRKCGRKTAGGVTCTDLAQVESRIGCCTAGYLSVVQAKEVAEGGKRTSSREIADKCFGGKLDSACTGGRRDEMTVGATIENVDPTTCCTDEGKLTIETQMNEQYCGAVGLDADMCNAQCDTSDCAQRRLRGDRRLSDNTISMEVAIDVTVGGEDLQNAVEDAASSGALDEAAAAAVPEDAIADASQPVGASSTAEAVETVQEEVLTSDAIATTAAEIASEDAQNAVVDDTELKALEEAEAAEAAELEALAADVAEPVSAADLIEELQQEAETAQKAADLGVSAEEYEAQAADIEAALAKQKEEEEAEAAQAAKALEESVVEEEEEQADPPADAGANTDAGAGTEPAGDDDDDDGADTSGVAVVGLVFLALA